MEKCKVEGCDRPRDSKGFCHAHYMRLWYTGDVNVDRPIGVYLITDEVTRFWSKVEKANGCWKWLGAIRPDGYGAFMRADHGGSTLAHRYAYEHMVGPIPGGLTIDHLCRNRGCVNPQHMETVSNKENSLRGISPNAQNARKTECMHGHPFIAENTYRRPGNTQRQCRACRKLARRAHYLKTGH